MVNTKIITFEQAELIINNFSNENNLIQVDEIDIKKLSNDKDILLIESDSLQFESDISYKTKFKCCLLESPEKLSLESVHNCINKFPTDDTVFGVKIAEQIHILFLMNV